MNNEKEFLNSISIQRPPTKEDLQIKKLQLQIEQLEEKKKIQQQSQQTSNKLQIISKYIGMLVFVLSIPIIIIGGFLLACAKASGGTSRSKRY